MRPRAVSSSWVTREEEGMPVVAAILVLLLLYAVFSNDGSSCIGAVIVFAVLAYLAGC